MPSMQYLLSQEEYDALVKAKEQTEDKVLAAVKMKLHAELDAYNSAVFNSIAESARHMGFPDSSYFDVDSWPPLVKVKQAYVNFKAALNYKV